jgi:hypothetical protein
VECGPKAVPRDLFCLFNLSIWAIGEVREEKKELERKKERKKERKRKKGKREKKRRITILCRCAVVGEILYCEDHANTQ